MLPVAAARVVLPAALQGLDRQQMTAAIKSAPLGRVDRKIALLRYVERLPLPDIAAQTHYSRTAIGYRLKGIEKCLMCDKIKPTNLPGLSKKRIRVDICQLTQCFIWE